MVPGSPAPSVPLRTIERRTILLRQLDVERSAAFLPMRKRLEQRSHWR
jgi:hypothetical protein